ncbi:MAG: hypothetical protein ACK40G_03895 [Cytophagaceae bacterium]
MRKWNLAFVYFFLCFLSSKAQDEFTYAHMVSASISAEERYSNLLTNSSGIDLPVGIAKELGGQDYVIGIDSLVLSPNGSYMSATSVIGIPGTDESIAFTSRKINISTGGIKGVSIARLNLAKDIPIRLSNKIKLNLKGSERKTYVEFDCNGFQGMGIHGEFEFCRDILIPELPSGEVAPEPYRVKAEFETRMDDWGSMLAKVSITPFQIPSLKGFGFYVRDAWVDRSDISNPLNIVFPKDYKSPNLEDNMNLWQGFFLREVAVRLPSSFSKGDASKRKEIRVHNLIIDDMGFSGWFAAAGVIPINEGSLGGWAFSLDEISVGITCNKISGAGFKGLINIPLTEESRTIGYIAIIETGDNYQFNIQSMQTLHVPLWGATMNLNPTSCLEIAYRQNQFWPKARLSGSITLVPDLGNGGDKGEFKGILFENLVVQAAKPHIIPGVFGIESRNNNVSGFSLTLNKIGFVTREDLVGFHFDISLHLMKDSESGFSGHAGLTVFGRLSETSAGKTKWKYDHLHLDRVKIEVRGGAYEIMGELVIYRKDKIYGSGFRGSVAAKFTPGIQVFGTAQFGKVNELRYWYVDALVILPTGIPVATGFGLYGFGGGLYHHMKRHDARVNLDNAPKIATELASNNGVAEITPPPSGITYIPDDKTFLGLKATVVCGTYASSQAFNADVTFEIAFNHHGGVNTIGFYGTGYFMTAIADRGPDVPIKADVAITMDFVNTVLHGNFDVYVNVPNSVRGIYPGNLAGGAVMHFEKNKWYVTIGTPDKRIGLVFSGMFTTTSYFMVGTTIPGMPPPPANVSEVLGGIDLNFMRDENSLNRGNGFCFGSAIQAKTGRKQHLAFYGQFDAAIGFDVMLKNYGNDVMCAGRSTKLGMNGWYASGQVYAYMQGDIGLGVDLPFAKGEYKILEIGAAAILQAKLPNPSWMEGHIGGYYSILSGKVKGNCQFKLTIGEQCKIVGGTVVSGIKVIAETSPKPSENNVNVFNNPQVAFNMPVDSPFDMEDLDGVVKTYRVKLAHIRLLNGTNVIPGRIQWNDLNEVAVFSPSDVLPAKKNLKFQVKIIFEEKQNGVWRPVIFKGTPAEESVEVAFTTGDAPEIVPPSNIQYSYPLISQYNFFKSETQAGYIQLIKGQDDLFEPDPKWKRKVRFIPSGEKSGIESDLIYNAESNTVHYAIPANLQNDKIYTIQLVSLPVTRSNDIDANVVNVNNSVTDDGMVSLDSKIIEGNLDVVENKIIYQSHFKTSKYNRFIDKINALNITPAWIVPLFDYTGIHQLGVTISGEELFDMYEIQNNKYSNRLIDFEARTNNSWYQNRIFPLIYKHYPYNGKASLEWRNPNELGVPPVKAVRIFQRPSDKILTDAEVNSGFVSKISGNASIVYDLPFYMYRDYLDVQQKCAALVVHSTNQPQNVWDMILKPYPGIIAGKYEVEVKYILPGINKVSSVHKITLVNY